MGAPNMEYNFLGRSGMKVSNICLGTMTFGKDDKFFLGKVPTQSNEEVAHTILDKYAELGGNFIDTADIYNNGKSESIIGSWLSKHERQRFVIATKVLGVMDQTDHNARGLSRRHIIDSIEGSLERLQTNYIDLYQSHMWDASAPLDETLRTFDDLIRCGKVRYYGASNVCGWQLQKMVDKIEMMGLNKCVSLQQQYNLLCRQSEFEEFMVCRQEGIGVIPWSPLKGGLLTGKFKRDVDPSAEESRVGYTHKDQSMIAKAVSASNWSLYNQREDYWTLIDSMKDVGAKHGKSVPQVALRWLLQKDFVPSVIIGATSVAQLEDNIGAATGWALSDEEMALLDDISPRDNPYPYEMIWRLNPAPRVNKYCQAITP